MQQHLPLWYLSLQLHTLVDYLFSLLQSVSLCEYATIYLPATTDGHLGSFQFLLLHSYTMNSLVHVFWWTYIICWVLLLKRGITGSQDMHMFSYSRYYKQYFKAMVQILHSHRQYLRVLVALYPCQHLLFAFLIIILVGKYF